MSQDHDSGGEAKEDAKAPDGSAMGAVGDAELAPDPRPRRAPFLCDQPDSLSEDAFGHRDYADALHSMVNDSSPPPTIGVFGPWGVGKSTIIGALQARLRGSITAFAYFDAWRYEGDSLRRQFLIDTAAQLKREGRLQSSYKPDKELRELEVDTHELEDSLDWSSERFQRAAILGFAFALIAGAALFLGGSDIFEGNVGQKAGLGLLVFALTFLASALSQSIVVNSTTLTRRSLQDPDRFSVKFANLLEALKPKRLVIAIDNLDRCAPDKAVEMLSTIKTYLEPTLAGSSGPRSGSAGRASKEVVFVISVDDTALRRHLVARERGQSKESDKIAVGRYVAGLWDDPCRGCTTQPR